MARGTLFAVSLLLALFAVSTLAQQQQRRVRVRARARPIHQVAEPEAEARAAEDPVQVEYYAVRPPQEIEEEPQAVVVVQPRARNPSYYGNQLARADEELRQQPLRPISRAIAQQTPRTKEHARAPPVQTIRNYNTINDDGSFTFGYEAADGSFKEETRGTDCVVRGKYGYIDPDGNKREFTYVSGNPCDPNNPNAEDDDRELEDESGEENIPVRPAVRRPTPAPRPRPQSIEPVFQNNYHHGDRIAVKATQVPITPRPSVRIAAPPATTYRPQIQNYPVVPAVTERPQQTFYTATPVPVSPTRGSSQFSISHPTTPSSINFDAELQKFQIEAGAPVRTVTPSSKSRPASQNVIQPTQYAPRPTQSAVRAGPTPRPVAPAAPVAPASNGINPYYSSQLIYDPASGQYNTVLYQNLPKGQGDFQLNHRLQSFVQPQPQHQLRQPQTQLRQPQPQQTVYINPQSYQPHAPQPPTPAATPVPARFGPQQFAQSPVAENAPQQSFYYINPNLRNQYSTGQIDAFLRGHNIQF